MRSRILRSSFAVLLALACIAPVQAHACTIPVFRYALERWPSSPHEIFVFHEAGKPLDTALFQKLKDACENGDLNYNIASVDVEKKLEPRIDKLWREMTDRKLPLILDCFPDDDFRLKPAWQGSFDRSGIDALLDSPIRRQLFERMTSGDSAVYVLLESGNAEADDHAASMLSETLCKLDKELVLPKRSEGDEQDPGSRLRSGLPLALKFSFLRVSQNNLEEKVLVSTLLKSFNVKGDAPVVFPIFGRGRILESLSGKDLNEVRIRESAEFLCGACSCQVKEFNPGIDLLMKGDWNSIFENQPVLSGYVAPIGNTPETAGPAPTHGTSDSNAKQIATAVAAEPAATHPSMLSLLTALSGGLVVLFGWLWIKNRSAA